MTKTVGDIAINVTADIGPLVTEMGRASRATSGIGRMSSSVSRKLDSFGRKSAELGKKMSIVSVAISGAAAAAFGLANNAATAGDEIAKSARGAGLSAEYYQEMAYAIGQVSDISKEELTKGLQRLSKTIGDAADGTKGASDALEKLGFTQSQIASGTITTQQAFDAYTKTMDGIKDPAIAAAVSSELLGRSGARLGAQLAGTQGTLTALRDRAHELGIVLSKDALDASEGFGDQMDDLKKSFNGVLLKIGSELLPLFTEKLIPALQDKVFPALIEFGDYIGDIIQWFEDLPGPVQKAIGILTGALAVGGPLLLAIAGVSKAFSLLIAATGPIGLFIAAAGLAYAAWQTWGDDIMGALGPAFDWLGDKLQSIVDFFQSIIDKAIAVKTAITEAFTFNGGAKGPDMDAIGLGGGMNASGDAIAGGLIGGVGAGLEARKDELRGYLDGVTQEANDAFQIKSPSRVFADIGNYIGEGLAQGIAESQALVAQAVSTMGGAAVDGAQSTTAGVLDSMSTMFAGSKKISAGIALANSWLAFTEVLKDPSFVGRPWARLAAAGAALASGLNAVKNIKSATEGGGSSSGGGAASATQAAAPAPLQVNLNTFGAGDLVSMMDFGAVLDRLNDAAGDRGYNILRPA